MEEKKINILTLVLSEKKFLNETKNHNLPLQVKWSVPKKTTLVIWRKHESSLDAMQSETEQYNIIYQKRLNEL